MGALLVDTLMGQRRTTSVGIPWGFSDILRDMGVDGITLFVQGCWSGTGFTGCLEVFLSAIFLTRDFPALERC